MSPFYTGHADTPFLNELMIFSAENLVYLVPVVLCYLWFGADEGKPNSVFVFCTIITGLAISYAMGHLYSHPAPYMQGYETLLTDDPENSFPSQHTTVMFAFAWPFFRLNRKRAGVLGLGIAALVGVSRVYVGVHFPIDIAGAVVASLIGVALVSVASDPIQKFADYCIRIESRLWTTVHRSLRSVRN